MNKLADTIGKIGENLDKFKNANNERVDHISDRLGNLEAKLDRPSGPAANGGPERKELAYFIRTGKVLPEAKAMTVGTDADGGAMVPELIADEILNRALSRGGISSIVRRTNSPTSDYVRLLNKRGQNATWIGEGGTRSLTNNFELREIRPTHGEIYAAVSVSNWLLNDAKFDVASMILTNAEEQFARSLETAVLSGTGSNQPTGITTSTPTTSTDTASPERAADVIQRVEASGSNDLADDLITTFFTLAPEYRRNATWVMSSASLAIARKLRDSNGSGFLWQANLGNAVDQSDGSLLGKPVITCEDLPSLNGSPGADGVLVGDFMQAYELVQIGPMEIIRDPYSTRGFTIFYLSSRFGGRLTDNNAIKVLAA